MKTMTPHDIARRCFEHFTCLHGTPPTEFWMDIHSLKWFEDQLLTDFRPHAPTVFSNRSLFNIPIRISAERGIWAAMSVGGEDVP
jgi:hypothetical protein